MNRIKIILASLLLIVTVINCIFYWQQDENLNRATSEIDSLDQSLTSLETTVAMFNDIDEIQNTIGSLKTEIADIEDKLATIVISTDAPINIVPIVAPSVVRIEVVVPSNRTPGSGIIITQDGYIITNSHVIEGNATVQITLTEGTTFTATVVSEDPEIDLAILKIDSQRTDFPPAILGSYEDIVTGKKVIALGYPYSDDLGPELSATDGIVSAIKVINDHEFIQTDTEISLGYGGGPLVTLEGHVIGMTTWGLIGAEGLFFAISVNDLISFIEDSIGVIS